VTWDNNKRVDINNSVATTEKMLNQSLKDLQTDCIDMYMIHWPDPRNDIRFTLEYLEKRREAGCIAALGLCNTNAEDLAKAKEITTILAIQEEYNVFVAPKKQEWLTEIESQGLGYMAWGTLDKGVLTGRVTAERKFEASDARSHAPWWKKEDRSNKFKAVTAFKKLIEDSEITLLDLAIHGALNPPAVTCALVGVRNSEQLVSATAALTHSVPEELIDLMGKIVREYIE
jgi:aryl-alcohol dehydrogenase-like predicted oxidoreductase